MSQQEIKPAKEKMKTNTISNQELISKAINGNLSEQEIHGMNIMTEYKDCQSFFVEIGKAARQIANSDPENGLLKKFMQQIEHTYKELLHGNCAYVYFVKCQEGLVWLNQMSRCAC